MSAVATTLPKVFNGLFRQFYRTAFDANTFAGCMNFHTTRNNEKKKDKENFFREPTHWLSYNDKVTPPDPNATERPPAWVCHQRCNIKYSPDKMWYITSVIRGMSVDEAIKQLSFIKKKGAHIVKEVLQEAQEIAVNEHNVEYKSNLWVAESFCGKGVYVRGLRKHAKYRFGIIEYKHCHYFVRLEEGTPPENYYPAWPTGMTKLKDFITELRDRRIRNSL